MTLLTGAVVEVVAACVEVLLLLPQPESATAAGSITAATTIVNREYFRILDISLSS